MILASSVHAVEDMVFAVLLQLSVIILAARLGAWLFGKMGQPQVVGEITAGLLLGPSCLGRIFPEMEATLFPASLNQITQVLGQLGLVLLLFLIGMEFDFGHLRKLGRAATGVAIAGIVAPFALGFGLAMGIHADVAPEINRLGFSLFIAVALSITAIPILGRIMMEFGISRSRLGALTISAAGVDDALGWILLAAVSAIVAGDFNGWSVMKTLGLTLLFALVMILIVRPMMIRWSRWALAVGGGQLKLFSLSILLIVIFVSAMATNKIGIFSIFGPFVLGACLWDQTELRNAINSRMRDFVFAFFVPIFFTYTGLHTNIGLINTQQLWIYCILLCGAAIAGKVVGCGLAARFGGLDWRESACVAIMMNTRALMGLVAINVGRDMGVIPDSVFSMLVIMAVVTTFMTSPILRRLLRDQDRDPQVA